MSAAPTRGAPPRRAMILAAGRGERMRPLTDSTPKPMLRVAGTPLIERHVERLVSVGISTIVVNLAWLGALIRQHLGDGSRFGVQILYSEESPQALETAGGIVRALPMLGSEPFVVVNGDVFTDFSFADLSLGANCDAHLVLVPNPPHHPQGDFGVERGLASAAVVPRYTFAGIAMYRPGFFAGCPDGPRPLKPLLERAMQAQRCSAQVYPGDWQDVGTPARLAALNRRAAD